MTDWPVYAKITGPIVMVGFGSIGKGTLPMIERHFEYDKTRITVLDPKDEGRKALCEKHGVRFIQKGLTRDNYREVLTPLLTEGGGQGFCVNLSVDTGSVDIMELCNELGALYIDTVNEPWLGFYFDKTKGAAARSTMRCARRRSPPRKRASPARPRRCRAAAPIPAWCRSSPSRRWSISPPTSSSTFPSRRPRANGPT